MKKPESMADHTEQPHRYTVGDVCERYDLTRKTLFYYDRKGLVKPAERVGSQRFKVYDDASIRMLEQVLKLREAGLSIEEIRCLTAPDCSDPLSVLQKAKERLTETLRVTEDQLRRLDALFEEYRG